MKKQVLIPLLISLFAVTAWAADWATTYEENYADATKAGINSSVRSYTRKAHPCLEWSYLKVRIKGDTLPVDKQAIWLNRNHSDVSNDVPCYLECAHIEGGVKNISFLYKQANSGDDGKIICLALKADDVRLDSLRFTGASTYRTKSRTYSKALGIKSNAKLTLQNISHTAEADYTIIPGRLTIGALTITPYLLYRSKDVTIGTKQQGYVNNELLDNTGGTETITYLSSDETIAKINAETGVVTPVKAGNVTISASLDGGTTTITNYTLHVVDGIFCENFSKVVNQTGSAPVDTPWDGDLFGWTVNKARRFTNDTIYDRPRVQGTWLAENDGNVQSTNAVEGGVKHITFDWMQWTNVSSSTVKVLYGDEEKVVDAQTGISQFNHFTIDEDINGKSNAVLKISNASPSSPSDRITIGAIKITPYLLYTSKTHSMKVGDTYTNTSFINNTESEGTITYTLEDNDSGASIDPSSGAVTALAAGEVRVKATWSEGAYTTYTLAIVSRITTTASYANEIVRIGLGDELPANTLSKTDGYDGTITYSSDNDAVAIVNASTGVVTLQGGVGQVKITASLPQTENYKAAAASYNLYVRDNGARVENFSNIAVGGGIVGDEGTDWSGVYFDWHAEGAIRHNAGDTIWGTAAANRKVWIATKASTASAPVTKEGVLSSKEDIEGGIKHLSFYWKQWASESNRVLRVAAFAGNTRKGYMEYTPNGASTNEKFLFGADDVMRNNAILSIKNESYTNGTFDGTIADDGSSCKSRIIIDDIYITPYLLYTTKEAELDLRVATTYTNTALIDNTESGSVTYSLDDNDEEATIDAESGEVTGLKAGQVTVKATWSEGAYTTYTLNIISITETEASYPNAEIHATMGEAIPANTLAYTDGYDGTISYASSVPAVASFEGGVLTLNAPGQTKITATLPETSNYTEATASYILTVSYANYESFNPNVTTSTYAKPEENAQGDMCKWYAYIGGVQTPNYFSSNAITTRAQRTNESNQGYVKSAKLSGGISALAFNYSMMFADNDIENWDIHVYVNDRLVGQLTNEEGGDLEGINGRTLNPMRTKVITGIDEPGRFVIRFENHSTIKNGVAYTEGNKGRFAIDNVSWENYDGAIVLDEEEDNSAVLAVNSGSTQDVQITRAALKGGVWNTLCLPFALPVSTLGVVENGVQTLSGATLNGDELTIGFTDFNEAILWPGTPYLVKPANDINVSGTYEEKQIASIASTVVSGPVTLQGIFSPTPLKANDYSTLFVGTPDASGNNLFYPSADGTLNGFRAYFKIADEVAPSAPLRRARFVVNEQQVVTSIDTDRQTANSQKLLRNGQLIIIRDGVQYDVLGRKL